MSLTQMKYWIVKPYEQYNYIKNPTFASPDFVEDWEAYGAGYTIESTGDEQRFGAYSMKVNTAYMVLGGAYYQNLSVTNGVTYTFSCYIKGVAGQSMSILVTTSGGSTKATTDFIATGYWQRVEATFTATETKTDYRVYVRRATLASTAPFYVDGCQFEHWKMTTFFDGYSPGCRWTGAPRNSASYRSAQTGLGGELVPLDDYCFVDTTTGLGNGNWNQVLTKMTSGGDLYQTHIRKSRQFSMIIGIKATDMSDLERKRGALIDLLRPDILFGGEDERRIIRYQGFDDNGNEVTQPVDIVCVPLSNTLADMPDLPTFQKDVLNFSIPSGLLQGAYNEGKELDLYANFPAEYIVKRDPNGNWCKWNGGTGIYDNLMKGQGTTQGLNGIVYCMAESPDHKIYVGGAFTNAGGVSAADYLARWNPVTEQWEAVISGINGAVRCMDFDANGDLYIGGDFTTINSGVVNRVALIEDLSGTPAVSGTFGAGGANGAVYSIVVMPTSASKSVYGVYIGGAFTSVNSVANTTKIARWSSGAWSALSTGLNGTVLMLAPSPDGYLYIGGEFTNADGTYGDYLCYWDGVAFNRIGTVELSAKVKAIRFNQTGKLVAGGNFADAGGNPNADNIAQWNGTSWESFGPGSTYNVNTLAIDNNKMYVGRLDAVMPKTTDGIEVWSNGSWMPLEVDLPGIGFVYSILPASDGSLYIGGNFSTLAQTPDENAKTGIVALNLNVASASANTYPFIQVTGPGTLKSIKNYRTGKSVVFDNLTLEAGEWINLNFDPLNLSFMSGWTSRGNLMRYIIPGSDYGNFYLSPGANYLSVFMTDTDSNSGATIAWTPKFWGLDGALL